jgi:4-hydroxybenzoate polyprenyltransferase
MFQFLRKNREWFAKLAWLCVITYIILSYAPVSNRYTFVIFVVLSVIAFVFCLLSISYKAKNKVWAIINLILLVGFWCFIMVVVRLEIINYRM